MAGVFLDAIAVFMVGGRSSVGEIVPKESIKNVKGYGTVRQRAYDVGREGRILEACVRRASP